jgi:adenylate kinase
LLGEMGQDCDHTINLDVPDDVVVSRLVQRGVESGRSDDNEETVRYRLEVYREKTEPLINYYTEQGKLTTVNGDQELEAVTGDLQAIVK